MHYPAQHNHLVPERSIFGFKSARRLKWRDQDVKDKDSSAIIVRRR